MTDFFFLTHKHMLVLMVYSHVTVFLFPSFLSGRVKPLLGRFSELEVLLPQMNVKPGSIDAVLLDAGCSSMQMDQAERGFSLSKDGPLDMRMDGER